MPNPTLDPHQTAGTTPRLNGPVLAALDIAIEKLRFGVVQLTVHEGKVVQLDVTEKQRF